MVYVRNKIPIEDIVVRDVILVECVIENAIGLKSIDLFARVLSIVPSKDRVEVEFIGSNHEAIWVDIKDCYYLANKQR